VEPFSDPAMEADFQRVQELIAHPPRVQQKSLILLGSLAAFVGVMAFQGRTSLVDVATLVGVLLLHELGHAAAMRLVGYTDVRIFFIPFVGAAAAGKRQGVARWKQAIVLLAGPLPGIVAGGVLVLLGAPELHTLALQLLIINGFNLLPLVPLDGGQLAQLVLFSRQRHLEILFQGLTAAAVLLFGLTQELYALAFIGYVLVLQLAHRKRILDAAHRLRDQDSSDDLADVDEAGRRALYRAAWELLPPNWQNKWRGKPKPQLATMQQVAERAAQRAPSWSATGGVLGVWLAGLGLAIACVYQARSVRHVAAEPVMWRQYEHRQPDFKVLIPGHAEETQFLDGQAVIALPDANHQYVIAWFELHADPETWMTTKRKELFGSSEPVELPAPEGKRRLELRRPGRKTVAQLQVTRDTGFIAVAFVPEGEFVGVFFDMFVVDRSSSRGSASN
jgi:Zn-dependent protease